MTNARNLANRSTDFVSVRDFGARGDGVTDDTAAIQAAIAAAGVNGSLLFLGGETYLVTSQLVPLNGQEWFGNGGQRSARIKKGANFDLVSVSNSACTLRNLYFDCNGASFTGRGLVMGLGSSNVLSEISVVDSAGVAVDLPANGGSGLLIDGLTATTTNPTVVAALRFGASDVSSYPKFISGLWLSGGLVEFNGSYAGRDCFIDNFFVRNIVTQGTATGTGRVSFANGRIASLSDTTTLGGADAQFANCNFSGPVYLTNAQGLKFSNCAFGAGITQDDATCFGNFFDVRGTAYAPTWTQASGTQPSLGDGTLTGSYSRSGALVTVTIRLVAGSTTTYGNSSTAYLFSLPFTSQSAGVQRGMAIRLFDSSAGLDYVLWGSIGASANALTIGYAAAAFRLGYPISMAVGDTVDLTFTYVAN